MQPKQRRAKGKRTAKKNVFPHTQAKLDLYTGYLARYLSVLINANFVQQINIFDLFCGQGKYDDGRFGSPIIAYKVINRIIASSVIRSRFNGINLTVNDQDAKKISKVQTIIEEQIDPTTPFFNISYRNLDAEEILDEVTAQIHRQGRGVKNLILLDPYGYKSIKKRQLERLLRTGKVEIILFLPVSNMYRFSEKAMISELEHLQILRQFIESFFPQNHPMCIEGGVRDIHEYISYLTEGFTFANNLYADSYYLERGAGIYYSMFFITKHIYGMEKFLETKWKLDPARGQGYNAERATLNMFVEHFKTVAFEKAIAAYKSDILEFLAAGTKHRNNLELYEFSIQNKMLSKHTKKILEELHKGGILEVWDLMKGEKVNRNWFYLGFKQWKTKNPKVEFRLVKDNGQLHPPSIRSPYQTISLFD